MKPTAKTVEILYCINCKVGIDAELCKREACTRCGGLRKHIRGAETWVPISGASGLAGQLFVQPAQPAKKLEVLILQAQDYFFH